MSGVILTFLSTRVVEGFSIHTHEASGSTPVVQVTVYLSGRIIPGFFFWGGGVGVLERNYSGFGLQHCELEKGMCFISYQNF